jgi:hypothetical protein
MKFFNQKVKTSTFLLWCSVNLGRLGVIYDSLVTNRSAAGGGGGGPDKESSPCDLLWESYMNPAAMHFFLGIQIGGKFNALEFLIIYAF